MRTATAGQLAKLAQSHRSDHVRVFIDRTGAGVFIDLSAIDGVDWLDSVEIRDAIDDTGSNATVVLKREASGDSVATLMEGSDANNLPGSYKPIVDAGRAFYIEACVLNPLTTPSSGDWVEVFRGTVDEVECGTGETISFTGRDKYGELSLAYIEDDDEYGNEAGRDLEDLIQDVLNDWAPSAITLYTPTSPGFGILRYKQAKESIAAAIESNTACLGWMCRYKWRDSTSQYELTLYDPDRAKTTPDHTFGPGDYFDLSKLSISRRGVRNAVKVSYYSAGSPEEVVVTDSASISRFGRQYVEVSEAATSQINTQVEAQAMADAILSDLALPSAEVSCRMPLFWPVELADLYRFSSNGVHHDQNLDIAVVAYSHTWASSGCFTELTLRGKPSGGYRRWLSVSADIVPRLSNSAVKPSTVDLGHTMGDSLIKNGDFSGDSTRGALPPDTWDVGENGCEIITGSPSFDIGTWGTHVTVDTTEIATGNRSLKSIKGTVSTGVNRWNLIHQGWIPAAPGCYALDALVKMAGTSGGSGLFDGVTLYAIPYDETRTQVAGEIVCASFSHASIPDDTWSDLRGYLAMGADVSSMTLPTTAKWVRLAIGCLHSYDNSRTIYVDNVQMRRVSQWDIYAPAMVDTLSSSITQLMQISATHMAGWGKGTLDRHTLVSGEYTIVSPGVYTESGTLRISGATVGATITVYAYKNGVSAGTATFTATSGHNIVPFSISGIVCVTGDVLDIRAKVSTGGGSVVVDQALTRIAFSQG